MVFIDLILVLVIFIYLYSKKGISLLSPAFIFLMIHFFFISLRAYQIFILDYELVVNNIYSSYLTINEVENGLIAADLSLVGFILGFFFMKNSYIKKGNRLHLKFKNYKETKNKLINYYLIFITILGIVGTLAFSTLPYQTQNLAIENNIFISLLTNLGVISAILLIYVKGFKKKYLLYLFLILAIFSIQGYHRYRVILPLIFLMGYYLKVHNLKMPPLKYYIIGAIVFIFSFPLKQIGKSIQQNKQIDLVEIGLNSFSNIVEGESGDLSFFEQSSAMIGSVDKQQNFFNGKTYIPVFLFWVPRAFWPDKPKLNQWQHDISSVGRNYGQMGQISLISGESYANFGFFGSFLIPFLLGKIYSKVYYYFRNIDINHRGFLLLLLLNMILFQVWRDGIISLIVFPIVNYLPIIVLFLMKKKVVK
jgi:hypothetical protein